MRRAGKGTADYADDTDGRKKSAPSALSAVNPPAQLRDLKLAICNPAKRGAPDHDSQNTPASTGRKRTAQGNALGNPPQNTSSPEEAKERRALPDGWRRVAVKDMADSIQYGHTASAVLRENGPRFLRITDIQDGRVDWDAVPSCDIPADEIPKYRLAQGDLVFARTGATTGKSFLIGDCPEAVFASYLIRVRVSSGVDSRYLATFFQSPDYWNQIEGGKRGIGQPNVNGKVLGEIRFPLAPLPEQRRIVAEIEKQFTRLEAGVAALRRVQANLKRYRAAVLKAACEGQLVPTEAELQKSEGRGQKEFETGEQLLQRILAERRKNWEESNRKSKIQNRKYREPAAPDLSAVASAKGDTANLPPLPEGWTWAAPDQLSAFDEGAICAGPFGTIFKARDFRPAGVPIIFLRHVAPGRYLTHKPGFMDTAKWEELFRPYSVFGGELLVTKLGEPPGVCAIYPEGIGPAMVTPDVMKMTPNARVAMPRFLMHYFNSQIARDFATGVAFGTTRLRLTLPIFREMPVPLPPLAEQTRIVAEVERRLSVVEELESVVSANLQRAVRLRQSVLQKAFTGELV
jgi:type I restriction enzyme S subunit